MYKSNTINSSSTVLIGIVIAAAIISVILAGSISTYFDNANIKFASAQLEKNKIGTPTTTTTKPIKGYIEEAAHIYSTQFKTDKSEFKKAPDFSKITGYINTDPVKLGDLNGKVVLVHFWTYTCINCMHTIPYLNKWYENYADKGLVIIGIHTPEFEFEKNTDNVKQAVKDYQIEYPVLQDNNYATWKAYQNKYWPRDYLIDTQGFIRYDHIGEGGYDETEKAIQSLLAEGTTQGEQ
jgi:thiol-disulfide isomerase/thioredoxin